MLGALTSYRAARRQRGFTLIELLVVIAVAGVIIMVAAPGLRDFILVQRLKAVNAQLVTDLAYARSEAAARNQYVRINFRFNASMSCYSIYTSPVNATRCNCLLAMGSACSGLMREIRTVQLPLSDTVWVRQQTGIGQDSAFAFDHVSGGIVSIPTDDFSAPLAGYRILTALSTSRALRTTISPTGRSTVCTHAGTIAGTTPC